MDPEKEAEFLHEALDRAHIVSSHLQMALGDHQITEKYEDIQKAYDKAVDAIEELYQIIGRKFQS